MSKGYKRHQCEFLPVSGICIVFDYDQNPVWILTIQREATEADLEENHYLEEVGDIIWTTELEIRCCPYCGEVLPGSTENSKSTYGEFRHIDSSGWSSKVL